MTIPKATPVATPGHSVNAHVAMPTAGGHCVPTAGHEDGHSAEATQVGTAPPGAVATERLLSKAGLVTAGSWLLAGVCATGFAAMATIPAGVWTRLLLVAGAALAVLITVGFALRAAEGDVDGR